MMCPREAYYCLRSILILLAYNVDLRACDNWVVRWTYLWMDGLVDLQTKPLIKMHDMANYG